MADQNRHEHDVDLDKIVHNAVATARKNNPDPEPSLRLRVALLFAALIVVANSVLGIYDSILLSDEVKCNHELQTALQVIGAQDRTNIQNVIDTVLSGKPLTKKQLLDVRVQFDETAAANAAQRAELLSQTCNDGSSSTTMTPSGSHSKPAK